MTNKNKIWDILAWLAFGILIIYILLKILKILHSPITIDIVALLSGAYFIGRYAKKLDNVSSDIEKVKHDIKDLDRKCPIFKEKGTKFR